MFIDKSTETKLREIVAATLYKTDERSPEERKEAGKALRNTVPLGSHATWSAPDDRPDPVALLKEQGESRLQELLPLRYERMGVSAFTFYRGGALIMASDLSNTPATGINVQACGDAHISNFGLFSSPERRTVFDINDFDETSIGPWEWDVKRMAASVEICGLDRGFSKKERKEAVLASVRGYRESMLKFATMGNLDVWYAHIDIDEVTSAFESKMTKKEKKQAAKAIGKAKSKNSTRAIAKLTEVVDGKLRIISNPPIVIPLRDMASAAKSAPWIKLLDTEKIVKLVLAAYRKTLSPDKQMLIRQYQGIDSAIKVVGVGSVGTRAFIIVMQGAGCEDPLVLQIKEAQESVLERFCGKSNAEQHGQRVVEGQRAMQTASDILLGWCRLPGVDGKTRDYYVRQLWDGKGSVDLERIDAKHLAIYARACGRTLAHAHARTGDRFGIAGYLGTTDEFDKAIAKFSRAYAAQNEADFARFQEAIEQGELRAAMTPPVNESEQQPQGEQQPAKDE